MANTLELSSDGWPKFDQCELLAVVNVARDLRVDFLKLAPSRDFETSSRAVKKLQGATLKDDRT